MKREIIKIDEEKCNGCGLCIPNCHEGALQIIDGKARLISDLMCDGLGACIGHCPEGAMEIEVRDAAPYDEVQVMEEMVKKGRNVVTAHMKHLKDHGEFVFLKQAVGYLMENSEQVDFPVREVIQEVHSYRPGASEHEMATADGGQNRAGASHANVGGEHHGETVSGGKGCGGTDSPAGNHRHHHGGGCPGSISMSFAAPSKNSNNPASQGNPGSGVSGTAPGNNGADALAVNNSQLTQWPVQMHLINPQASHFRGSYLLLAADCVAYSTGNFHDRFLKGKTLAIACPKLDTNKEVYLDKLVRLIDDARINTLTVMKMEVPCCSGIEQMAVMAVKASGRKVPVKSITVGIQGDIRNEEWL